MLYSVTGATGLLGNNVVRKLLEAGHQVRVGIRASSDERPLQGLDVDVVTGELTDPRFAEELMVESDGLIHAAGFIWFGSTKREQSMRVNVDGSCVLARQCAKQRLRMVYISSVDALAAGSADSPANEECVDPPKGDSVYVASKRAAEVALLEIVATDDLDLVIVNPGLLVGPFDWKPSTGKMILSVTDGYVPLTPSGGLSVADARNVADGVIAAMQQGKSGQRYIMAGENITYLALWRKMAALAGRIGPLAKMPQPVQKFVGGSGDLLTKVFNRETNVNSAAILLGSFWNYYDSTKATKELGYDSGSIDVALADAWKWLVENGYSRKNKTPEE